MVSTEACRSATCVSSATPTFIRNRRVTRLEASRSSQIAMLDTATPAAPAMTSERRSWVTPSTASLSQTASSAPGTAASTDSTSARIVMPGSAR